MYTISKEFSFSASHKLTGLPVEHPCSQLHGHNYLVIVELQSANLDKTGMVVDYRKLTFIKEHIDAHLDHKHLNDVLDFNPTAENLAKYIFDLFSKTYPQLIAVSVKEDTTRTARYTPLFGTGKMTNQSIAEKINKNML